MNRDAAIEAGAKALDPDAWELLRLSRMQFGETPGETVVRLRREARERAAAVIDAALPHLVPDAETIAATLALAYGSHVSPPQGGRDWKAAEAVHALLIPVVEP